MKKATKEPEPESPKKPPRKRGKKPTDLKSQVIDQMNGAVETQPVPLAQAAESYIKAQAEPATITNMKELTTVIEKPVQAIEQDVAKAEEAVKRSVLDHVIPKWVLWLAGSVVVIIIGAMIYSTYKERQKQERAATVKAKMDELAKKLVEVSAEITKGEAKVYVDQETAEAYKNDRVAFENSMKSKRLVNLNEHDEVKNKIDSAHNIDAIRNLLDTILTIKAQ